MKQSSENSSASDGKVKQLTIGDLEYNQQALVRHIETASTEVKCRLLTLGLYPGVNVEVLRRAPMGDPLQIRSGTTLMSIRQHEAEGILVELCA